MTTQTTRTIGVPTTATAGVRVVTFSAQDLDGLGRQVTAWLLEHPSTSPVAFSHAAETRPVLRNPVSLAGPELRVFYTGILLVQT